MSITKPNIYFPGDRILLVHMDDPFPVPDGTRGTVDHIDDAGHLHIKWDNGRCLALIPGYDNFRLLTIEELEAEMAARRFCRV